MYFVLNGFKKARLAAGMTQKEAADKIGVLPQTIIQWEKGANKPTKNTLPKVAEVYGVTVDELLKSDK